MSRRCFRRPIPTSYFLSSQQYVISCMQLKKYLNRRFLQTKLKLKVHWRSIKSREFLEQLVLVLYVLYALYKHNHQKNIIERALQIAVYLWVSNILIDHHHRFNKPRNHWSLNPIDLGTDETLSLENNNEFSHLLDRILAWSILSLLIASQNATFNFIKR